MQKYRLYPCTHENIYKIHLGAVFMFPSGLSRPLPGQASQKDFVDPHETDGPESRSKVTAI